MSNPSHQSASRINAAWAESRAGKKAFEDFYMDFLEREMFGELAAPKRFDASQLPPLTLEQQAD